ncbi:MAG: hypothetical protein ACOC7V_10995, partial [Spirochaetota bacterium]
MHWSDHGPMPRGKRWPYDSGVRVPLIVRWPESAGNPGAVPPDPGTAGKYTLAAASPRATVNAAGGHEAQPNPDSAGPVYSHDGSHRRPPLLGFGAGSVTDRLVSTIDLGPTVLSLAGVSVPPYMHGRVFLGPQAGAERDYAFFSRDRYDTSYDMIRAARDRRYKYFRHYYPREPYNVWLPYRNHHPIMQELFDGYRNGTLTDEQLALFRPRPAEELYDTTLDPYELENLAANPEHRETLERMRDATEAWCAEVGDTGEQSESEMVRRWYPGGEQPTTATPIFVPFADGVYGETAITTAELSGDAMLQIQCATQGASIAWRFDEDLPGRWRLYQSPIRLGGGRTVVHAKAIRIGYKESEPITATVNVVPKG